jgi:anhydro-N-acetylmuramic acid kinase
VAVLNIGGVANVTWIGASGIGASGIGMSGIGARGIGISGDELLAFDTGPGNGPLDDWVSRHTGQAFDRDGALALSGIASEAVLGSLLGHGYFARPAPKSLDRLDFSLALAASGLDKLSPADGAATLVAFTAAAVAAPVRSGLFPVPPGHWLVTGGGRRNPAMMAALRAELGVPVEPAESVGWDGDALEAQCFGFLAARVVAGLPLSFPGTTGVAAAARGGRVVTP